MQALGHLPWQLLSRQSMVAMVSVDNAGVCSHRGILDDAVQVAIGTHCGVGKRHVYEVVALLTTLSCVCQSVGHPISTLCIWNVNMLTAVSFHGCHQEVGHHRK